MKLNDIRVIGPALLLIVGVITGSMAEGALVSYWPFDGNATATVGTSGEMGWLVQTAADRNGVTGGALQFDAASPSEVTVAGGGGLDGLYTGTISMWVKWNGTQTDVTGKGTYGTVLARHKNDDNEVLGTQVFSNNLISLTGEDPSAANVAWNSTVTWTPDVPFDAAPIVSTAPVGDGVWHHIAVTYQPHFTGTCELFVDGVSQGTAATDAFSMDSSAPMTIGAWTGVEQFASATIDDVAIFDDMLSAAQIGALAAQTKTPLTVGAGAKPAALPIRGVVATASSELVDPDRWPYRPAGNLTDGVGRLTIWPEGIPGKVEGMWLSTADGALYPSYPGTPDPDPEVTFDLGQEYQLSKMVVYNYNEVVFLDPSLKEAEILVSTDGVNFTSLGNRAFTQAPGDETNPGQIVTLGGVNARYVKINVLSTYGTASFPNSGSLAYAGLNEVDFYVGTGVVIPGDTNGDMIVDQTDATTLASHWGDAVAQGDYGVGDFNSDGRVNAADASILAANWGSHVGSAEGNQAVPEPSGILMLVLLAAAALMKRHVV